jgi:DNA-binding NtrC family response regulator
MSGHRQHQHRLRQSGAGRIIVTFWCDTATRSGGNVPTLILKPPRHLMGRSILLVEDEMLIARGIEQTPTHAGMRVLGPAASVGSAMRLIAAETPDAAILDLELRGELATPVARMLRDLGVPFVLATTHDHLCGEATEFEGVENLGKPVASARCVEVLGEILA